MFTQSQFLAAQQLLKKLYEVCCEPVLQNYGLTRMELDVLMILAEENGIEAAGEMVAQMGFTKSHVSKAVEQLVRRGWVQAIRDDQDRRRQCLRLTKAAQSAVEEGRLAQKKLMRFLYHDMDEQEKRQVDSYLVRAAKNAQSALELYEGGKKHGAV
ncbi:MarR family transcriptional regulator [Ruthenibacterium sp. CLA-JM-H11]|uniref:MarR family transcriptional regulator n=1 Tax=Ruthenibacterium intestinale TaxID=3133163 RepID=A0ABV1GHH3_9FIRM